MPPESAALATPAQSIFAAIPAAWRLPLTRLALAWVALIIWFADDWADMTYQWWSSSTFNHILFVPFILVWLVWVRREELAKLSPGAWWPGTILVFGALFLWLLGAFSGLNLARQLGAVLVLQASAVTLLGPRVSAGLTFPLGYMFFLVPFGDELVPTLQMITAKLTIALTHLSGIPAEIEGVFIDTPAGLFEVAEACSGVKFLVAMVALGVLVAHTCFTSWKRRAAFLALSVALPILANGVRAWGTIYIAQFKGVEFAASFDHIVYGWVFFAVVMALLLGIGWRFFDRAIEDPMLDAEVVAASPLLGKLDRWPIGGWSALASIAGLVALFSVWFLRASSLEATLPAQIALPEVPGWDQVEYAPTIWWEPRASGAPLRVLGRYSDGRGREVDVFIALYSSQGEGREAGGFGQGALVPESDWRWLESGPAIEGAKSDHLLARGQLHRSAATFYRTGDLLTGSNTRLKLANMRDRLLMRAETTQLLILSSEGGEADANIAAFMESFGPTGDWMDGMVSIP